MAEEMKNKLFNKDRLLGMGIAAVFALMLLIVPPMFGVTQLRPLGMSFFAAIVLSFFYEKD